jgi:nitroimidazol reductase NimA-like FMN-containing flavoprotein (pyridoxamine 5'-phosphate oxidase superfamily)
VDPPSERTRVRRHPERAEYSREVALAVLDEALICHLGLVDGGVPFVIPTMYARQRSAPVVPTTRRQTSGFPYGRA